MYTCDPKLQFEEKTFVRKYVDDLNRHLAERGIAATSFEAAWFQYRIQVRRLYTIVDS